MKKSVVLLLVGAMVFGMAACGRNQSNSNESSQSIAESTMESTVESAVEPSREEATGMEGQVGFSEEMTAIREAVKAELGEDYWPNMPVPEEFINDSYGIPSDWYVDYFGEMPMMSTQVDSILVLKAAEGKAEEIEAALQAYHTDQVENSMQYPMNVGKIQAGMVERIGDYVCYVCLGGDVMNAATNGDDAIIKQCQEHNQRAIDTIKAQIGQ